MATKKIPNDLIGLSGINCMRIATIHPKKAPPSQVRCLPAALLEKFVAKEQRKLVTYCMRGITARYVEFT